MRCTEKNDLALLYIHVQVAIFIRSKIIFDHVLADELKNCRKTVFPEMWYNPHGFTLQYRKRLDCPVLNTECTRFIQTREYVFSSDDSRL